MESEKEIWDQFKSAITSNVTAHSLAELYNFIKIPAQRKEYLKFDLCNKIAADLGLSYADNEEFLRVDYTLYRIGERNKFKVPVICIESENNWESTDREICKLLSINAPLKVLIVYDLSEEQFKDNFWEYILPDFQSVYGLVGIFAVVEINTREENVVKISTMAFDSSGDNFEKFHQLISVSL